MEWQVIQEADYIFYILFYNSLHVQFCWLPSMQFLNSVGWWQPWQHGCLAGFGLAVQFSAPQMVDIGSISSIICCFAVFATAIICSYLVSVLSGQLFGPRGFNSISSTLISKIIDWFWGSHIKSLLSQPQNCEFGTNCKLKGMIPLQHCVQMVSFRVSYVYHFCMAQNTFHLPQTLAAIISRSQ